MPSVDIQYIANLSNQIECYLYLCIVKPKKQQNMHIENQCLTDRYLLNADDESPIFPRFFSSVPTVVTFVMSVVTIVMSVVTTVMSVVTTVMPVVAIVMLVVTIVMPVVTIVPLVVITVQSVIGVLPSVVLCLARDHPRSPPTRAQHAFFAISDPPVRGDKIAKKLG